MCFPLVIDMLHVACDDRVAVLFWKAILRLSNSRQTGACWGYRCFVFLLNFSSRVHILQLSKRVSLALESIERDVVDDKSVAYRRESMSARFRFTQATTGRVNDRF